MSHDHSKYCHCVCTDLIDLQSAIEMARAIHIQYQPPTKPCLVCNTVDAACDNCKWNKDCIICGEVWPCETFKILDHTAP